MNRSLYINWGIKSNQKVKNNKNSNLILNFGPQHPAAHGVLRLILQLSGELIERSDIHIGLLHRGTEKLLETKHFTKGLPYFDRLDYVSMMTQEHAYCLAVEYIQKKKNLPRTINIQRVLFDELTRLLNHFLCIACHALDVGSMSSLFWAFEEREKLLEFYERVSGARMHAAFHRIGWNTTVISDGLLSDILYYIKNCYVTLNEMHNVLTYNKIWKQRLINIGTYTLNEVQNNGITGVLARCVGLKRDLRLSWRDTYSDYDKYDFKSFIGINGDCYDRFLIRMSEMGESLTIANQCINLLGNNSLPYESKALVQNTLLIKKRDLNNIASYEYMEDLIEHFLEWHTGTDVSSGLTTVAIESPKGEFGVSLLSDNTSNPYRCKIRSPSYHSLQFLPKMVKGHMLADLATIIGTIDIVFGEIDR